MLCSPIHRVIISKLLSQAIANEFAIQESYLVPKPALSYKDLTGIYYLQDALGIFQ